MSLKDFIIQCLVRQYFVIYTGSMIATFCFCKAFYPTDELPLSYLAWMFLFSLVGTLPSLVFYSRKELSKKQWGIRIVLHFILLEAVLMVTGRLLDLYEGVQEGIWFVVTIFLVYVFVWAIMDFMDRRTAEEMNEKLKERRRQSQ